MCPGGGRGGGGSGVCLCVFPLKIWLLTLFKSDRHLWHSLSQYTGF